MKKESLRLLNSFLEGSRKGVFLYTNAGEGPKSYLFLDPVHELKCRKAPQTADILSKAEQLNQKGFYIAGYISYEAGKSLIQPGAKNIKCGGDCLYMAAFRAPLIFHGRTAVEGGLFGPGLNLEPSVHEKEYLKKFSFLKKQIAGGEAYQVNYTFRMKGKFKGSLKRLFYSLCNRQKTPYTAFINDGNNIIMSFSPEMFFEKKGDAISMKPMKGTLLKPCTFADIRGFKKDVKTSAENIMIVDLIRNDLGKICAVNSIRARDIFKVEEYGSLYQMTSKVTGRLKPGTGFTGILTALFPCGSVTGAPKISAMRLIDTVEKGPRGVYTGAIGFMSPGFKKALFNIPIRTLDVNMASGVVSFGTGSGIVHDSDGAGEYRECLGKTEFLKAPDTDIALIESLLLKDKKYFLLRGHLSRLKRSADFFGIKPDIKALRLALKKEIAESRPGIPRKVRALIYPDGRVKARGKDIGEIGPENNRVAISRVKTDSSDEVLYHKTTRRELYDGEYEKYRKKGFYDVLFTNEKGELTEAHSSNVVVKMGGKYFTPPVKSGLLAGTYREYLMKKAGFMLTEKALFPRDLKKAEAVYLCNSVRGLRRVKPEGF